MPSPHPLDCEFKDTGLQGFIFPCLGHEFCNPLICKPVGARGSDLDS